jgi:HTH-type transcriptional regulator/antitoxin HipB
MKSIATAKQLGRLIKSGRKSIFLTQKELAGACGTGIRFIQELERGKVTCSLGKALWVAQMLGIRLEATLPNESDGVKHDRG